MGRKAYLSSVLILVLSFSCLAQKVTRSRQVPGLRPYDVDLAVMTREEKDSVRMIAELWKNYVESFSTASVPEDVRRSMWVDGMQDYLSEFDDGVLLYSSFRENRILDIRKMAPGIYEIVGMTYSKLAGEDYNDWVECVYRVCAMDVVGGEGTKGYNPFRLCNWLDAVLPTLEKKMVGGIDYYCAPGCQVPEEGEDVSGFVSSLADEYGFRMKSRIRYVITPTVDQCEQFSGYLFNAYSNPLMGSVVPKAADSKFYGRVFGSRTLMSNYYDDLHDIALLIVRYCCPGAFPMVQEGFATFHGGYMDGSYESLKASFKDYLQKNEKIDFSDEDSFYDHTLPVKLGGSTVVIPLENLLGAFLVEYAWKNGGPNMVKKLLSCHDYPSLLNVVGAKPETAGAFLRKKISG